MVVDTEADFELVLADSKDYSSRHHPLVDEHDPPIRLRYWLAFHCRYPYLERDLIELESEKKSSSISKRSPTTIKPFIETKSSAITTRSKLILGQFS